MEDNQIYSIQLLENEGITPSVGGGQDKTYCPTKQEFIDSGFSKSGYDLSIDNIIAINQLIPKTALTETASIIKFDINPISLYPCSDWCAWDDDGINEVTPSASTNGAISFSGVSSVINDLMNGNAASIELCTDKNDINGTLVDDFEWSFYSADTFTVDGKNWMFGYVESVLPQNKTNENKTYYLVLNYQYETPGDQSIFEIIQSKYWEPPYWDYDSSGNFPHSIPKTGGTYTVSIKDPYNIGWIVDENSQYNISEKSGSGDTSFSIRIPKATSVEAQTGSIYGYRPKINLDEMILNTPWSEKGYVNIYDVPSTANCMMTADDCIHIYQYGLDKPSWNYSASTLPYSKQYEASYASSRYSWLYYYIKITNNDNVKWKCEMPYWLTFRDESYASKLILSGGTKSYSGETSYSSFGPKLTEFAYQDKSHYDGVLKLYYQDKDSSNWNLIDSKSITKCARPYIDTDLTSYGNFSWNPGLNAIYVKDEDNCGYSLTISGDSNYSAWTFTAGNEGTKYTGNTEYNVSIPQNLTDNDIEGYISLNNPYGEIFESIPFKQECKKMKVYFIGQNFKDGYAQDGATYIYAIDNIMTTQGFAYLGKGFDGNNVQNSYIEMHNSNIIELQNAIDTWGNNFNIIAYTKFLTLDDLNDNSSIYQEFCSDSSWMAEEVEYTILEKLCEAWNNDESNVTINTSPTPSITTVSWNLSNTKSIGCDSGSFDFYVYDTGQTGYMIDYSSWISCGNWARNTVYKGTRGMTARYDANSATTERNGYITLMNSAGTVISKCIIIQSGQTKVFDWEILGPTRMYQNYYISTDAYFTFNVNSNTDWTISFNGEGWTNDTFENGKQYNGSLSSTFNYTLGKFIDNQLNITVSCPSLNITENIIVGN